jgi:hypothetical protein
MALFFPAELAEFFQFKAIWRISFIFLRRVIFLFAVQTGQGDNFSHSIFSLFL